MKFLAYPKYKPSGVEWLGNVPEHWTTKKVTYGFQKIGSGTTPRSDSADYYDGDIPWVTTSELRETVIYETKQSVTQSAMMDCSALRLYPVGTVLFAMYGATIGRLGILGIPATLNQACCAFAWPKLFEPKFLFYWLLMRKPILVSLSSGGGQPNLSQDDLRQIRVPIPTIAEQQAIAGFLDAQTARLDALLAKRRALIERLSEKRTALISRTVTRGLNPKAKFKSSGIELLGDVPEHWKVKRLRRVVKKIEQGWSPECSSATASLEEWGVVKSGCCNGGNFNAEENKVLPPDLEVPINLEIKAGDILMSRASGSEDLIGSVAIVPANTRRQLLLSDKTYRLRCTPDVLSVFLARVLQSPVGRAQIQAVISGAFGLAKNIAQADVKDFALPVPPPAEQIAIAEFLDGETAKLDLMMAKVEAAIGKLQEYRTALITAAVTGKIDVRKAAA